MLKKIIFSAGGTGGHIFPAIHLMNHFHDKGYEVLLVTDSRGKIFLSSKRIDAINQAESENYEFAAMKSTGISLQRAMKSLSIFIVLLAVLSFFFANSVIPLAEFNFFSLRRNIAKVKPAMAIAEGQFNQLNDINIKVAEKSGNNGQYLKDVIIHQKKGRTKGNFTVIKSNTGEFVSDEFSDVLQLVLIDGNYYDDIQPKDYIKRTKNKPSVKSKFDKYIINIDLSKFNDIHNS